MKYFELSRRLLGTGEFDEPVVELLSIEEREIEFSEVVRGIRDYMETLEVAQGSLEQLTRLRSMSKGNAGVRLITLEAINDSLGIDDTDDLTLEGIGTSVANFAKKVWAKLMAAWAWIKGKALSLFGMEPKAENKSKMSEGPFKEPPPTAKKGADFKLYDANGNELKGAGWGDFQGVRDFLRYGERIIDVCDWATNDDKDVLKGMLDEINVTVDTPPYMSADDLLYGGYDRLKESFEQGQGNKTHTLQREIIANKGSFLITQTVGKNPPLKLPLIESIEVFPKFKDFVTDAERFIDDMEDDINDVNRLCA